MALVSGMSGGQTYEDFIKEMHDAGLKTTNIREGKEANFADYGNALSDDLQQRIMDSYDCEQDYVMQQELAAYFKENGRSVLQNKEFYAACKALGFTVEREWTSTSYISDYKAGNFDNSVTENGHINVFTISDGKGGEIVIADANGNAALEIEEVFMNRILGDIDYEISVAQGLDTNIELGDYVKADGTFDAQKAKEDTEYKITDNLQKEYNSTVEQYLEDGYSKSEALSKADSQLGVKNITYTGDMDAIEKEAEEPKNIFLFEEEEEAVA